jgi:hypothetical protein
MQSHIDIKHTINAPAIRQPRERSQRGRGFAPSNRFASLSLIDQL